MNQIVRQNRGFDAAQPLRAPVRIVPAIHRRPHAESFWPGWMSWIIQGVRRYRGYRRTIKALDGLSHEQLKDIGFRRLSNEPGDYERLP